MKTLAACLLIVAAAASFGWKRHQQLAALRDGNAALRESIAEIARYEDEAAQEQVAIDSNEVAGLRADWLELAKIRSEIGRLRESAAIDIPSAQKEVESLSAQAVEVQKLGSTLLAQRAAEQRARMTGELLKQLTSSLVAIARENDGRFPRTFDEAESMKMPDGFSRFLEHMLSATNHLSPSEAQLTGVSFGVSARDFEFVLSAKPLTISGPPALLLREIVPRRLPDGRWARFYGFTDGTVKESISLDGNLSTPGQAD